MKKLLFIENVATSSATNFYRAALEACKSLGWEFHLAYNCTDYSEEAINELEKDLGLSFHQIDFHRNPLHPGNIKAYGQLCDLVEKEKYDLIHCNTPTGGVLGRIVASKYRVKPVIYQVHGFHFYKGAPFLNWAIYYPIEKIFARFTDVIITINKDDYIFAQNHIHPRSRILYVPGVGIELNKWESRREIRQEIGLSDDDFVILVVGRLEKNKDCKTVIKAVSKIKEDKMKLVFCGDGEDREMLQRTAKKMGVYERTYFLGNRADMSDIYHMSDVYVLASLREGLSRSIMEAMVCGLPCVVTNIRGNRDLIDYKGGGLFNPKDSNSLMEKIKELFNSNQLRIRAKTYNQDKIRQFSLDKVIKEIIQIYEVYEENGE